MKAIAVADGVYQSEADGRFWIRPVVAGKRTWRKLKSLKLKPARNEAAGLMVAHRQSSTGTCRSPFTRGKDFASLAKLYLEAGCPNSQEEPRAEAFMEREAHRLEFVVKFYGTWNVEDIKRPSLLEYMAWRVKQVRNYPGLRTTELDWCTLSNVINFAVRNEMADINYVGADRQRLRANNPGASSRAVRIVHCREFAPADGNELNSLAHFFFAERRSQAVGFQMLFEAFTGARTNEALKLRMDARNKDQPGYIEGNHLFLSRSKKGKNPYVLINSDLGDFIECHREWHRSNHAGNPWWFPGQPNKGLKVGPLNDHALNGALRRATKMLGLPKRTSHGMRSYFVTRRRGENASEAQIADELGITSIALLEQVYGGRPPNWDGKRQIRYWPDGAAPSWHRWKPGATRELDFAIEGKKIVEMKTGLLMAPDQSECKNQSHNQH